MPRHAFELASDASETEAPRVDGRHTRYQRSRPLAHVVKQKLLDEIIAGVHPPGSMLSLAKLADRYGVSRTPVREALSVLEHDGLVTSFPNQGFLVNSPSLSDLKDLYLMREVLETVTAQRAAERATGPDLEALRNLVPPRMAKDRSYDASFDHNTQDFHLHVAKMAESARLESALSDIFHAASRLQFIGMNPPSPKTIVEDHRLIGEAIADGDSEEAARLMRKHILELRACALEALLQ
jgi:DNA-binding GntR family transcriptional regulator